MVDNLIKQLSNNKLEISNKEIKNKGILEV